MMPAFRRPRIRFMRAIPASMIAAILVMLRQTEFAVVGWSGIPGNHMLHVCRRDYIQTTGRDAGVRVRVEAASGTRSKHLTHFVCERETSARVTIPAEIDHKNITVGLGCSSNLAFNSVQDATRLSADWGASPVTEDASWAPRFPVLQLYVERASPNYCR